MPHETPTSRLLMVSNRLPFEIRPDPEGVLSQIVPSTGGLVRALDPVLRRTAGLWFGWPGDATGEEALRGAGGLPYEVVPIALAPPEVAGYYDGFSNRTLWPLFHDLLGRTSFEEGWWRTYQSVNGKFADAVAARLGPDDFVWAHDFHLLLFARELRARRPGVRVGLFLHVPFPPQGLFQRLPWRREIAEALLEFDTIGFQSARDLRAFGRTVRETVRDARQLDAADRDLSFERNGRASYAAVFPIGIDFAFWDSLGRDPDVVRHATRFRRKNGGRKIVLGVDRLDYSKGIAQRLRAFGELLERHPEARERVQFVQIAVPSRISVREYRELKREIDELIGRINGTFATPSWVPVNYLNRSFSESDLAAYYRAADVALVTPVKDGMNLVAKEFCAASVAGRGVLVLSEFAGAAAELAPGALIVNPHDAAGTAEAIHRALSMPPEEQEKRLFRLRRTIRDNDVHRWAELFLAAARDGTARLRSPEAILEEWDGWKADRLLLSLDYDGTLVPIRPLPGMAAPASETLDLVRDLAALPGVSLVLSSGRALAELDVWFPDPAIVLIAGHGAAWRRGGKDELLLAPSWLAETLDGCRQRLQALIDSSPGALLEDKGTSIAVHYRLVEGTARRGLVAAVRAETRRLLAERPGLRRIEGRSVVEIGLSGVDKGTAFRHARAALGLEEAPALVLGDDETDEDAFSTILPGDLAVHVGARPTRARFALKDVGAARDLLARIAAGRAGKAFGARPARIC